MRRMQKRIPGHMGKLSKEVKTWYKQYRKDTCSYTLLGGNRMEVHYLNCVILSIYQETCVFLHTS